LQSKKFAVGLLFLIVFIAMYLVFCFAIPGMRIKLEAEPMEVFFENITHMMLFKTLLSLMAALIVCSVPLLAKKNKQ